MLRKRTCPECGCKYKKKCKVCGFENHKPGVPAVGDTEKKIRIYYEFPGGDIDSDEGCLPLDSWLFWWYDKPGGIFFIRILGLVIQREEI